MPKKVNFITKIFLDIFSTLKIQNRVINTFNRLIHRNQPKLDFKFRKFHVWHDFSHKFSTGCGKTRWKLFRFWKSLKNYRSSSKMLNLQNSKKTSWQKSQMTVAIFVQSSVRTSNYSRSTVFLHYIAGTCIKRGVRNIAPNELKISLASDHCRIVSA